jgi:23S rRNA (adenine2503-C2)-methyltransferase
MMTLEYILIKDVNDSHNDAEGLAGIARRLRAKINIIAYSPVVGLDYEGSDEPTLRTFIQRLEERKVHVTRRQSKGTDIAAACGQLAGRAKSAGRHS